MKNKLIIAFIICAYNSCAQVIDYEIDSSFNSSQLFSRGGISDIDVRQDDNIMIVGSFNNPFSDITSGAIVDMNGNLVFEMNYGGPFAAPYMDSYLQYGSVLRKFSISGIDDSFLFEYRQPAYSGFVPDQETCTHILDDDSVLVGGIFFTDSLDLSANSLRQLCMVNSAGAPVDGFPMVKCEPFNGRIHTIDTLSSGAYIIAGSFTHVNGHPANNIAKLNPDFTVDTEFENPMLAGGTVIVKLIDSQDRIWVSLLNGDINTGSLQFEVSLFRIKDSGMIDETFNIPQITRLDDNGLEVKSYVNALLEDSDGKFILAGSFQAYNEIDKKGILKVEDNGDLIDNFLSGHGIDEAIWGSWSNFPVIGSLKRDSDGNIYVGGRFSSFGEESYHCLVRLQPSGFVSTRETNQTGHFNLFPNPASELITISFERMIALNTEVSITDISGRQLYTQTHFTAPIEIDVSEMPPGTYTVSLTNGNSRLFKKLIIQ